MAYSGTYTFAPSVGELVLTAYGRLGVRRTAVTQEHMEDARMGINLLFARWATKNGPNLWEVEKIEIPFIQGIAEYALPTRAVDVLDVYVRSTQMVDRIITSISRSEYAGFPDKITEGTPTVFWYDRTLAPKLHVWQPPSANQGTLHVYIVSQIMDAGFANGQQPQIPYRFLSAFISGLAAELARTYRPELVTQLDAIAATDWQDAASADVENAPMSLVPGLASLYR